MDPLSVIASSLAITEALGLGIKTLRGLANTSSEFREMLSELSSLQAWMNQLNTTIEKIGLAGSQLPEDVLSRLESAKQDLGQVVDGMNEIQQQVIGEGDRKRLNRKGEPKVSLIQWQRCQGKVRKLREKAKRCREDLSGCLDLVGLSHQVQQHQTGIEILTTSYTQYSLLQSTFTKFESRLDVFESILRTEILNGPATTVLKEPVVHEDYSRSRKTRPRISASESIEASSSATNIQVPTQQTCVRYCKCQCHRNTAIRSPAWSRALIGSLVLQFNGAARLEARPCDIPACHSGKNRLVKLTYRFPDWILRRAVFMTASWGSPTNVGASLYLSVPRVNEPKDIYWVLNSGDIHRLREMVASQVLLPTDINEDGELYINYAMRNSDDFVQVVKLFIAIGFNPSFPSPGSGWSATTIATWYLLYNQAKPYLSPENHELCQELVESGDLDERAGASYRIRDAVLGISSEPLGDALALEPGLVNEFDDAGYSPLHWAAKLGYLHQAKLLLEAGANIDLRNGFGKTALDLSLFGGNVAFASFMLSRNPNVKNKGNGGYGVFHHCRDPRLVKPLLDAGADPNDVDYHKRTLLHHLAMDCGEREGNGIPDLIRQLVGAGADIEAKDHDNCTGLLYAVEHNNVEIVNELYQLGARMDGIDNKGCGLLHVVARDGNFDTINHLRGMGIAGVDSDLRDSEGNTPIGLFQDRMRGPWFRQTRPTQQHVFAFYALISEIQGRNWGLGLFLESKEELENSGYLRNIRRWLGWQWQKLYDDHEFGDYLWNADVDEWPDFYNEDDDIEYDTAILFGDDQEDRDLDLVEEEDDEGEEFFDAME